MPTANFPDSLMDFCSDRSHDCVQNCEGVALIVRAINFRDLQPMWSWSTNVTDGSTNAHIHGWHAIAIPRFAVQCTAC